MARVLGPWQRTALRKKLINQLFFLLATLKLTAFGGRGINFAMLCCRIAPLVFPHRSPRGPLQRTALRKKLINQLFLFLATMSANKFAPYYPKTKGVEFSTPFCFVCSLRRGRDS
ncbi:MAG: hypothetical protein IJB08_06930, partial [Alistipes sp.]|nr:hypothetical protein [Alistipes sp.]